MKTYHVLCRLGPRADHPLKTLYVNAAASGGARWYCRVRYPHCVFLKVEEALPFDNDPQDLYCEVEALR